MNILKYGDISQKALLDALREYETTRNVSIPLSPEITKSSKAIYNFFSQYIIFVNEDGSEYTPPVRGCGRRKPDDKVEIIPSTEPAMLFNDVKNGPYFIIQ